MDNDLKSIFHEQEPSVSPLDLGARMPSAVSSTASVDTGASLYHKRKLSANQSDEEKPVSKLPRVFDKGTQLNGVEEDNPCNITIAKTFQRLKTSRTSQKSQPGVSKSAVASRKLREKAASGTYTASEKRLETWKAKITDLDPSARFDPKDSQKVLHSQCNAWVRVKEPGDATRFKRHVETCQVKPVPVRGTLVGMGWLTKKSEVGTSSSGEGEGWDRGKEAMEDRVRMPCRGLSEMDDALIDLYLKRTQVGGGGGRSIHVISGERFNKKFMNLTCAQIEEVYVTQRAEWRWTNDHANSRVYSRKCERFTSSHSLALSLCAECKDLVILKAFTDAINKPMPLEKNLKFRNTRYIHPTLVRIYKKAKGLRAIIEHIVSDGHQLPGSPN